VIADPGEAVFVPPERARARLIEREIPPGVAVRAVVLANRAPCPLADVRAPSLPGHAPIHAFLEAPRFRVHRLTRSRSASASGSPAGGARAPIGSACGMAPDEHGERMPRIRSGGDKPGRRNVRMPLQISRPL